MRKFAVAATMLLLLLVAQQAAAGVVGDAGVKLGQKLIDWGSPDLGKAQANTKPPSAASIDPNCDPQKEAEAKKAADNNEVNSGLTSHVNLSCLEKYKKFSMGMTLGYPNPWDLLQQALGQVCSAADMKIAGATAPITQGLPLPGGIGRVNTGAVFGSTASGAGVSVGGGGVSGTGGSVLNQGGSGYTVPPLWK